MIYVQHVLVHGIHVLLVQSLIDTPYSDMNWTRHLFGHPNVCLKHLHTPWKFISHIWHISESEEMMAGWWFGTCFIFPYIGNFIIPTDFHIVQRGRYTTNQMRFIGIVWGFYGIHKSDLWIRTNDGIWMYMALIVGMVLSWWPCGTCGYDGKSCFAGGKALVWLGSNHNKKWPIYRWITY